MSSEALERAIAAVRATMVDAACGMSSRDKYELFAAVQHVAVTAYEGVAEACPDCGTCGGKGWVFEREGGVTKSCPARCIDGKDLGP